MPGGRPPIQYNPDKYPAWVRALAIEGLTIPEMAQRMGISKDTIYSWKKKYPEFSDALKEGRDEADGKVELSLYKRAIGYEYTETKVTESDDGFRKTETKVVQVAPDPTSCIFWLKNRKPREWRDKQEIEHSGQINWMELVKSAGNKPE